MTLRLVPLVALALAMAGCTATVVEDAASVDGAAQAHMIGNATLPAWAYPCPPGGHESAPDVCVARVPSAEALGEPAVARHPTNSARVAVAAMATTAASPDAPFAIRVILFVTTDSGASWERSEIPVPAMDAGVNHIDPALAFAPDGTLHYSGLIEQPYPYQGLVFHTQSVDGGRSWSDPVVVSDPEADGVTDRNWLSVGSGGTVFVSWQNYGAGSVVAWRAPGEDAWQEAHLACNGVSPVLVHASEAFVACPRDGVRVFVVDTANGTATERGTAEMSCTHPFLASAGDTLAFACGTLEAAASRDAGRTWQPVDLAALASIDDAWPEPRVTAVTGDGMGGVHVVFAARHPVPYFGGLVNHHVADRVGHVVWDVHGDALSHEARLTTDDAAPPASDGGAGVPAKDDFHGASASADGVVLAWMRDRGIDVAFAEPTTALPAE